MNDKRSPFTPYNPFLMPSKSLRANQMGMSGSAVSFTKLTTTDTTNWISLVTPTIYAPANNLLLLFGLNLQYRHSVANATFGVRLVLYTATDGTQSGSGFVVGGFDNLTIPVGTAWYGHSYVFPVFFSGASWSPGLHAYLWQVRNYTAGTLSAGAADGASSIVDSAWTLAPGLTQNA